MGKLGELACSDHIIKRWLHKINPTIKVNPAKEVLSHGLFVSFANYRIFKACKIRMLF